MKAVIEPGLVSKVQGHSSHPPPPAGPKLYGNHRHRAQHAPRPTCGPSRCCSSRRILAQELQSQQEELRETNARFEQQARDLQGFWKTSSRTGRMS